MGYYTNQIIENYNKPFSNARKTLDEDITSFYNTFKTILNDYDFPSKAEERWTSWNNQIKVLASELSTEIENKYNYMYDMAALFDGWFDALSALSGNNGYDWAKENGFTTDYKENKEVIDYGPKAGSMDYSTYRMTYTYTWKAFSSVTINSDGYIDVIVSSYTRVKDLTSDNTTHTDTKITVTNETEYQSVMDSR